MEETDMPIIDEILKKLPRDSSIFITKSMIMAAKIVDTLEERKLSAVDLSIYLGIEQEKVDYILSGTYNFTLRDIAKIEALLAIELIKV